MAEGAGSAYEVSKEIENRIDLETRVVVLGHIQRGGTPTALDRVIASKMGGMAVELLRKGETKVMTAVTGNNIITVPLKVVTNGKKALDLAAYNLAGILAI